MTSTDISNAVNAVINAYPSGSRIGFSGVEVGQCPAPVCEYMVRLGMPIPAMANARADGWGTNFPAELAPYLTHEAFEPGKQYPEGTIYIWDSPHIAFSVAASDGSNTVKVFEQNADPDGAGCQVFNRTINTASHTCTYVLIPITETTPPPNPITSYEPTTEVTMQTNKQPTNWWNLNGTTTDISTFHPAAVLDINTQFPVAGYAHHINGYTYAMEPQDFAKAVAGDFSSNNGVNTLDLSAILPPPPPVPYVPPAAPVAVKLATQIQLVVTVPTYATALNAQNAVNSVGTFPAGTFYQFGADNGMLNIGLTNQSTTTVWINPKDNVAPIVPPVPEQVIEPQVAAPSETAPELDPLPAKPDYTDGWKASYIPFYPSQSRITKSIIYTVKMAGTVMDLGGTGPEMELVTGHKIGIYGKFTKDDIVYYRPRVSQDTDFNYWYGIPVQYNGRAVLTLPAVNWMDRLFNKGQELKSIFTSEEPKLIDSIFLNPFKRRDK